MENTNKKLKWYEDPIRKKELMENWKQKYKARLEWDITAQFRQEPVYKKWREDVFNFYNGICEKCGASVTDISVTYRHGTMKDTFKLYGVETLKQAVESIDLVSMTGAILQCKGCYKVIRNKKSML